MINKNLFVLVYVSQFKYSIWTVKHILFECEALSRIFILCQPGHEMQTILENPIEKVCDSWKGANVVRWDYSNTYGGKIYQDRRHSGILGKGPTK